MKDTSAREETSHRDPDIPVSSRMSNERAEITALFVAPVQLAR